MRSGWNVQNLSIFDQFNKVVSHSIAAGFRIDSQLGNKALIVNTSANTDGQKGIGTAVPVVHVDTILSYTRGNLDSGSGAGLNPLTIHKTNNVTVNETEIGCNLVI